MEYDVSWMSQGNCLGVDTEIFYPERGEDASMGKQVCAGCKVRAQCLTYALEANERHGTWGGVSERGRRRIRKLRINKRKQDRQKEQSLARIETEETEND